MNKKILISWLIGIFLFSFAQTKAVSVLDILNEEANKPIEEEQIFPNQWEIIENTINETDNNPTHEISKPKPSITKELKSTIEEKTPESFVMNFSNNKSCSYLNKKIKNSKKDTIWTISNKTINFRMPIFSKLQEQDGMSIFLKGSIITFKDNQGNVLSQMQISDKIKETKIYVQGRKLFILGKIENKIALLSVNFTNLISPTIQQFNILNGFLEDVKVNEDGIIFLTKMELTTTSNLEIYQSHIENWKIKIQKKDFDCKEAYYIIPDKATSKNLWNKMSLYSIYQINTKDFSLKQKSIIGSNLNVVLQKDHFLAYAFIKEDNPLICNPNIQCTLENEYDYTLLQRFDFQKTWPTHLIPWHILTLQENNEKINIISNSHFLSLDKNFKIIEKYKIPTLINKAFFIWETPIGVNEKISYYVYQNQLLNTEIEIEDWTILTNNNNSFTLINENWLKYFIFNESWIAIKRNIDFKYTQINNENIVFNNSKNLLHLPMIIWEEKPSEICNYEKVKIDWEIQEKESCHTENVIKQSFMWLKIFKIPTFKVLDEQKAEWKLENIFVWTNWTLFE